MPACCSVLFYVVTLLALRREVQPVISWIFLIIVGIFAYPYYNIAHTLFTRNYDIKKILGISLKLTLRKFKNYLVVYILSILGVGLFLLIFYLFGLVLGNTVFSDPLIFSRYYTTYSLVFTILLAIVFYKIIFFNRIYFYVITETLINKLK